MAALDKLEASIGDVVEKNIPKLPPNARKSLAKAAWVLALVFGILQLWAAYGLWELGHRLDKSIDYLNSFSAYYGGSASSTSLGVFFYVSLLFIAVDAALLLLATPGLKAFRKAGWNLIFYSMLLNLVYGVFRLFSDVGSGAGALFGAAIGTAIGLYFLFQIRSEFTGKGAGKPVEPAAKSDKK